MLGHHEASTHMTYSPSEGPTSCHCHVGGWGFNIRIWGECISCIPNSIQEQLTRIQLECRETHRDSAVAPDAIAGRRYHFRSHLGKEQGAVNRMWGVECAWTEWGAAQRSCGFKFKPCGSLPTTGRDPLSADPPGCSWCLPLAKPNRRPEGH